MKHSSEKTTILFINKNARITKPVQVSSRLIAHWKKYVAAISIIFLALIAVITYLASQNFNQVKEQHVLSQKVYSLKTTFTEVDTNEVRKKFSNIDKELMVINNYLKARGIKPIFKGPQGGEQDSDIISTDEITSFYEGYLKKIIYNFSYTPLGFPFLGTITSTFGHRENPFSGEGIETHKGLDIRGPIGSPVKAMAKGEVEFAGLRGGFGNCIMLKHANGFETLYGHLSKILVHVGQQIEIGQQIGNIGSTGRSTGPHLHYEIHLNGEKINPQSFLNL